jgi:nitrous oxidase accessory protein NosD
LQGNTVQVEGASYNTWDAGYPSGGNYWSDYTGLDLYSGPYQNLTGSDGIGDSVYRIDADNIDRYPLMQQYPIPEFPSFLILPLFMIISLLYVITRKRFTGKP